MASIPSFQSSSAPTIGDFSDPKVVTAAAGSAASSLLSQGRETKQAGADVFAPLISSLLKIFQGDATAVDQASAPGVNDVIEQYETARRNIAEFSPRGGGTTSALAGSRVQEGSDIAKIRASARGDAQKTLEQIGSWLMQAGISSESAGIQGLLGAAQAALQGKQIDAAMWESIGAGIGTIAAAVLAVPTGGASLLALPGIVKH